MNRKPYLALTLGAILSAGLACAADQPAPQADPAPATFSQLDTNKDGKISPEEAVANKKVADQFVAADTDKDGYLEPSEFQAIAQS